MTLPMVSAEEMRAGQLLTGFAMVAFLAAGFLPRYGRQLRLATLAVYLVGIAGFIVWFLIR
jgi:hypothetical protein